MHVVVCSIELFLPNVGSLKEKRHIVKSITQRIRARINASVSETGHQDSWKHAVIGVAMVSGDKGVLERQINLIRGIVDNCMDAETVEFTIEYV